MHPLGPDHMNYLTTTTNLLASGCAILLIRKGPSRRLKLLTLTVGLMALSQSATLLTMAGACDGSSLRPAQFHQTLTGALSLLAMYLLGLEIYDRKLTDRRLRLSEYDAMKQPAKLVPDAGGLHVQG